MEPEDLCTYEPSQRRSYPSRLSRVVPDDQIGRPSCSRLTLSQLLLSSLLRLSPKRGSLINAKVVDDIFGRFISIAPYFG